VPRQAVFKKTAKREKGREMRKEFLTCSVASIAVMAAFQPAVAQDVGGAGPRQTPDHLTTVSADTAASTPDEKNNGGLAEIVVTARKVSENLQKIPVAVTAFSGEQLRQQSAVTVSDVAKFTPGLVIRTASGTGAASVFQLRGQFQNDSIATLDPSVGVYVDGLYWARSYGINANLLDIRDVQTLKGPQGTLFGRNTTGGAILIDTNDPSFRGWSGLISGIYGRFDLKSGTAILNAPLVDNKIAIRIAYERNKSDGYVRDVTSGQNYGQQNDWTIRGKLLIQPTESLKIVLAAEQYKIDALTSPFRLAYAAPTASSNIQAGFDLFGPGPTTTRLVQGATAIAAYIPGALLSDTIATNVEPRSYAKTQTYSGTVTLDTFFGAIKFITGYRKVRAFNTEDLDGSPFNIIAPALQQNLEQYSNELQITGKAFDDKIDFATGAFFFHENGTEMSESTAIAALNPNVPNITDGRLRTNSQGLYGQATWHATDRLSLTGGARYSVDDKRITLNNRTYNAAAAAFLCSLPNCPANRSDSFPGISWTAGADYKLTDDMLAYAKASHSFRSGGENLRASGTTAAFVPFKPEKVTSYEGGIKSEFFDHRLRVNLAGYYSTIDDIQRSTIVVSGTGQSATIVGNAGRARILGGEAEATGQLTQDIQIIATGAYTDPKYLNYIDPNTGVDRSHERFDNVPKWTYTLSGIYEHRYKFGKILLRGDYIWQAKTPLQPTNYYLNANGVAVDASNGQPYAANSAIDLAIAQGFVTASTMNAAGIVNARLSLTVLDDRLELAVYGRNLTDNRGKVVAQYLPLPLGLVAVQLRDPRTWGVTATFKFGAY
jgi:iron complex outermembrane receptor protein